MRPARFSLFACNRVQIPLPQWPLLISPSPGVIAFIIVGHSMISKGTLSCSPPCQADGRAWVKPSLSTHPLVTVAGMQDCLVLCGHLCAVGHQVSVLHDMAAT